MSNASVHRPPRTVLFGMPGALLSATLQVLERLDVPLLAIVTPAPQGSSAAVVEQNWHSRRGPWHPNRPNTGRVTHMLVKSAREPVLIARIQEIAPELMVIACFPWLLPNALYRSATWLAVNLHPSLLPAHRGPDPLFWTFFAGESRTGVSLHRLDNQFDTGPVLAQSEIAVSPGTSYHHLEQETASYSAELLSNLILRYPEIPPSVVQTSVAPSNEGKATSDDLLIHPDWSVDRTRRFIAGVATSHGPLRYPLANGRSIKITDLSLGPDSTEIVLRNGTLGVKQAPSRQVFPADTH